MAKNSASTKSAQSASVQAAPSKSQPAKGAKGKTPAESIASTAKVGNLVKGAKAATPAPKSAAPERGKASAQGQAKARGQFAGKKIRSLVPKGEAHGARGNAGVLLDTVLKFKTADEALGAEYQRVGGKYDGETWTVLGVDLAYLVRRELIAVE